MRAVIFAGPGKVAVEELPEPAIQEAGDAVVAVRQSAICGSDLHLLHGKTPGMREGGVIGHEFVGTIYELGEGVSRMWEGTRVLGSFLIACGSCAQCAARRFNFCSNRRALGLGALAGDLDGAQAEYVRVPNADVNLHPLTGALSGLADEQAVFAGDILATALHAAVISEIGPGDVVAVVGAGPVGLLCAAVARRRGGRVVVLDTDPRRVEFARARMELDAEVPSEDVAALLEARTGGSRADVAIEAVGAIPAFKTALGCVREGGRVAVVGVYGAERYELAMGRAWISGLTVRFAGMANVQARWDEALFGIAKQELDPTRLITHRLPLEDAPRGYELFGSKEAMKVLLRP